MAAGQLGDARLAAIYGTAPKQPGLAEADLLSGQNANVRNLEMLGYQRGDAAKDDDAGGAAK
jgi:hypothetical protein